MQICGISQKVINTDQNSRSQTTIYRVCFVSFQIVDRMRRKLSWASCKYCTQYTPPMPTRRDSTAESRRLCILDIIRASLLCRRSGDDKRDRSKDSVGATQRVDTEREGPDPRTVGDWALCTGTSHSPSYRTEFTRLCSRIFTETDAFS